MICTLDEYDIRKEDTEIAVKKEVREGDSEEAAFEQILEV